MRALPAVTSDYPADSAEARKYIGQIKETLDTWTGNRGDVLDKVVTFRELYEAGVEILGQVHPVPAGGIRFELPVTEVIDSSKPPAPTGLQSVAILTEIRLVWSISPFAQHSHTEIWRSPDVSLSNAILVGSASGNSFTDTLGERSATFYYWLRHVSRAGVRSDFHSQNGFAASTSMINGVNLADHILATTHLAEGSLDLTGTKFAGNVVSDAQFEVGAIGNAAIGGVVADSVTMANAVIGSANIDTLTLDSSTLFDTGCIQQADIASMVVGQEATANSLGIGTAWIESADFEDASIQSANLGFLFVGNMMIQDHAIVASSSAVAVDSHIVSMPFVPRTRTDGQSGNYPIIITGAYHVSVGLNQEQGPGRAYRLIFSIRDSLGVVVATEECGRVFDVLTQPYYYAGSTSYPLAAYAQCAINFQGLMFVNSGLTPGATYTIEAVARRFVTSWEDVPDGPEYYYWAGLATRELSITAMEIAR